jgi:hypothetical protein
VLTVAKTDERAKNLALLAGSLLPERARKYYFFSPLNNFSLENPSPILEAVHLSSGDADLRYQLVRTPGLVAAGSLLTIRKSDSAFSFLPSPVKPTERVDGTTRQGF